MAYIINSTSIVKKFKKRNKRIDNIVLKDSLEKFHAKKETFLEEFDNHPVTEELSVSGTSDAGSDMLGGRSGNLRAFIGFYPSDDPVGTLRNILNENIRMITIPDVINTSEGFDYHYNLVFPTLTEIYDQTPYPDGHSGGSWVQGIEKGIAGLSHYLFSTKKKFKNSRSGKAIQVRQTVSSARFQPRAYISELLKRFKTL